MKKVASLGLLLVLLFNFGGYLIFFSIQLQQIRHEAITKIKQGVPTKDLVEICISPNIATKLKWKEENEFSLNGLMYDVVYKETENNLTTYYCYADADETELLANLNRIIKNLRNHRKRQNLMKILKVFQNKNQVSTKFIDTTFNRRAVIVDNYSIIYKNIASKVKVPPPKFI